MFRANPAASGRTTPTELRRAREGESFEESKRVSTRQNARAAPSCAGGEEVDAACGSSFEEASLVSIGIKKNQIAHNVQIGPTSIVSKDDRCRWLLTVVTGRRRFSSNKMRH